MLNIKLDYETAGIPEKEIMKYKDKVKKIHNILNEKAGKKNEFVRMARIANKI